MTAEGGNTGGGGGAQVTAAPVTAEAPGTTGTSNQVARQGTGLEGVRPQTGGIDRPKATHEPGEIEKPFQGTSRRPQLSERPHVPRVGTALAVRDAIGDVTGGKDGKQAARGYKQDAPKGMPLIDPGFWRPDGTLKSSDELHADRVKALRDLGYDYDPLESANAGKNGAKGAAATTAGEIAEEQVEQAHVDARKVAPAEPKDKATEQKEAPAATTPEETPKGGGNTGETNTDKAEGRDGTQTATKTANTADEPAAKDPGEVATTKESPAAPTNRFSGAFSTVKEKGEAVQTLPGTKVTQMNIDAGLFGSPANSTGTVTAEENLGVERLVFNITPKDNSNGAITFVVHRDLETGRVTVLYPDGNGVATSAKPEDVKVAQDMIEQAVTGGQSGTRITLIRNEDNTSTGTGTGTTGNEHGSAHGNGNGTTGAAGAEQHNGGYGNGNGTAGTAEDEQHNGGNGRTAGTTTTKAYLATREYQNYPVIYVPNSPARRYPMPGTAEFNALSPDKQAGILHDLGWDRPADGERKPALGHTVRDVKELELGLKDKKLKEIAEREAEERARRKEVFESSQATGFGNARTREEILATVSEGSTQQSARSSLQENLARAAQTTVEKTELAAQVAEQAQQAQDPLAGYDLNHVFRHQREGREKMLGQMRQADEELNAKTQEWLKSLSPEEVETWNAAAAEAFRNAKTVEDKARIRDTHLRSTPPELRVPEIANANLDVLRDLERVRERSAWLTANGWESATASGTPITVYPGDTSEQTATHTATRGAGGIPLNQLPPSIREALEQGYRAAGLSLPTTGPNGSAETSGGKPAVRSNMPIVGSVPLPDNTGGGGSPTPDSQPGGQNPDNKPQAPERRPSFAERARNLDNELLATTRAIIDKIQNRIRLGVASRDDRQILGILDKMGLQEVLHHIPDPEQWAAAERARQEQLKIKIRDVTGRENPTVIPHHEPPLTAALRIQREAMQREAKEQAGRGHVRAARAQLLYVRALQEDIRQNGIDAHIDRTPRGGRRDHREREGQRPGGGGSPVDMMDRMYRAMGERRPEGDGGGFPEKRKPAILRAYRNRREMAKIKATEKILEKSMAIMRSKSTWDYMMCKLGFNKQYALMEAQLILVRMEKRELSIPRMVARGTGRVALRGVGYGGRAVARRYRGRYN